VKRSVASPIQPRKYACAEKLKRENKSIETKRDREREEITKEVTMSRSAKRKR